MADDITTNLIRQHEGYRSQAYWDVNHYRVGYGSDTWTDANGKVHTVTSSTVITPEDAERDLQRRIAETQSAIVKKVGADAWGQLPDNTKAAVTSVAYNYGGLDGLRTLTRAIQSGDPAAVSSAIAARANDNGGVNSSRRLAEAEIANGVSPSAALTAINGSVPASGIGVVDERLMSMLGSGNQAGVITQPDAPASSYTPLPAPAPLVPPQPGTPSGTQLGLTNNGLPPIPMQRPASFDAGYLPARSTGQMYRVGDLIPTADGTHKNLVVADNGFAKFVRQPNPGEVPGVFDPYKSVGPNAVPSAIGGYINSKPEIAGPLTIAKGMGLTADQANMLANGRLNLSLPSVPQTAKPMNSSGSPDDRNNTYLVRKSMQESADAAKNTVGSIWDTMKNPTSLFASKPAPAATVQKPAAPAYRVTPQNMGVTPPPVSRAPVSVPKPAARLPSYNVTQQNMGVTPPLGLPTVKQPAAPVASAPRYSLNELMGTSMERPAVPASPAIPPIPAGYVVQQAANVSPVRVPTSPFAAPPMVLPSIVPTPTVEPNMLQKIAAQTTIGKVANVLSGGGPQVNDPNEATRRNIRPITYNFAPVKAAGQAYDVMGRDLAFMPKSVQTSSRWNTGY